MVYREQVCKSSLFKGSDPHRCLKEAFWSSDADQGLLATMEMKVCVDNERTHLRFVGYSSGVYRNTPLKAAVIAILPVKENTTEAVVMATLPSETKVGLEISENFKILI